MANEDADQEPLDLPQIHSIGRVLHGFLYQHVIAAAAATAMFDGPGLEFVVVERDEDVEVGFTDARLYLQIKAREQLTFSVLSPLLVRFNDYRRLHATGRRAGGARIGLVLAAPPGRELANRENSSTQRRLRDKVAALAVEEEIDPNELLATWDAIEWYLPGAEIGGVPNLIVTESAALQLQQLSDRMRQVERLANSPMVTAAALATSMHALAADSLPGFSERRVSSSQLSALVERVAVCAEQLPTLPADFIPLPVGSAALAPGRRLCLLGVSGSGKTTQLSWHASQLSTAPALYLRVTNAGIADLAQQLRSSLESLGIRSEDLGPPPASRVPLRDRLTALVGAMPAHTCLIIDDAHELIPGGDTREFARALDARSDFGVAFAAKPQREDGNGTGLVLRSDFGPTLELVDCPGWRAEDIADFLSRKGAAVDPVLAGAIRRVTGGHPQGVHGLLAVAQAEFDGDMEATVRAVDSGSIDSTLKHVVALQIRALPNAGRQAMTVLAMIGFRPSTAEFAAYLDCADSRAGLAYLREHRYLAPRIGALVPGRIQLHDTFMHEAAAQAADVFDADARRGIHATAADQLRERLQAEGGVTHVAAYYHNLAGAGEFDLLVDLVTDGQLSAESLQRYGVGTPTARVLLSVLEQASDPVHRYWIRDAVIFLNDAELLRIPIDGLWKAQLAEFHRIVDPNDNLRASFHHKAMRVNAASGDIEAARQSWQKARAMAVSENVRRILDSQFGGVLFNAGDFEGALAIAAENSRRYRELVGIPAGGLARLPPKLVSHLVQRWDRGVAMHLADALEAAAMCLAKLGDWSVALYQCAEVVFQALGAEKARRKAEFLRLRELVRNPETAEVGLAGLQRLLDEILEYRNTGALIDVATGVAAAFEHLGAEAKRDETLRILERYEKSDVEEALEDHRQTLRTPIVGDAGHRSEALLREL